MKLVLLAQLRAEASSPASTEAPAARPTWGGKGCAKETVKNIKLQGQVKTHFTFSVFLN